jgi:hypothetical protein
VETGADGDGLHRAGSMMRAFSTQLSAPAYGQGMGSSLYGRAYGRYLYSVWVYWQYTVWAVRSERSAADSHRQAMRSQATWSQGVASDSFAASLESNSMCLSAGMRAASGMCSPCVPQPDTDTQTQTRATPPSLSLSVYLSRSVPFRFVVALAPSCTLIPWSAPHTVPRERREKER